VAAGEDEDLGKKVKNVSYKHVAIFADNYPSPLTQQPIAGELIPNCLVSSLSETHSPFPANSNNNFSLSPFAALCL